MNFSNTSLKMDPQSEKLIYEPRSGKPKMYALNSQSGFVLGNRLM